jgi:hypothetical protein
MTLNYGQGRVFHTVLGHADYSIKCAGFVTTLRRGTEWAATGKVTIPMLEEIPTATESRSWSFDPHPEKPSHRQNQCHRTGIPKWQPFKGRCHRH